MKGSVSSGRLRIWLLVATLTAAGLATAARTVHEPVSIASLQIDFVELRVADSQDILTVEIEALDLEGQPVEGARLRTVLVIGLDEVKATDTVDLGGGRYRAELTSPIADDGMVVVTDPATGISVARRAAFVAGNPVAVSLSVGPPEAQGSLLTRLLQVAVVDAFGNPVMPPDAEIELGTDFGRLEPTELREDGTFLSRLLTARPGIATVTASDPISGLRTQAEVTFPAVALECPPALHITDNAKSDDRRFPVTVRVFTGAQGLGGYELFLEHNRLTSFAGAVRSSSSAFPPPEVVSLGGDRLQVSAELIPDAEAPSGWFPVAELTFHCLGEGDSAVHVMEARLTAAPSGPRPLVPRRLGTRGPTFQAQRGPELESEPTRPAVCPNKRVESVCVNPILVEGTELPQGFDLTAKLKEHFERIQSNLDSGCCRIDIDEEFDPVRKLKPPQSFVDEVDKNEKNGDDRVIQVEWDARSERNDKTDEIPANQIILSPGMADLLCDTDQRRDECINVYIVPDAAMVGKFPPVSTAQQANREAAAKTVPKVGSFGGADIKRQRVKPDGSGCEDVRIFKRGEAEPISRDTCRIDAIVLSPNNLEEFKTIKHEVGHLLGLRHPWEYTDAQLETIENQEKSSSRSVMRYGWNREGFTEEECRLITEHDCNGFQR